MKRQYTNPEVSVINVDPSEIICLSVGFGDGSTSIMHAKRRVESLEEEDEEGDDLCLDITTGDYDY